MNILFRVDSSDIIGTGHLYRCLNFADLYSDSNNITFISKKHSFNLNNKIKEKYTCYEIELKNSNNINLNIDTWLGESEIDDADKTINIIKDNNLNIDWLIIDHYSITKIWEEKLNKYVKKICVIDDFTDRKHNCNIIINQQLNNNMINKYKNIINDDCKILAGNDYLFFNKLYYNLIKKEKYIKKLERINIFMGGSDLFNVTGKIIDICNKFNKYNNLNITFDVIIGKSNKNYENIKSKIKKIDNFNLYYDLKFIGNLLFKADLAIGAPGTTSYERCITQTPTLLICLADNQNVVIKKLLETKTCKYIGNIHSNYSKVLLNNLHYLNKNVNELKDMSIHCKNFIDLKKNKSKDILYKSNS